MIRLVDFLMNVLMEEMTHCTAVIRLPDKSEYCIDPKDCKSPNMLYRKIIAVKIRYDEESDYYSTCLVLSSDENAVDTSDCQHAVPLNEFIELIDPSCKFKIKGWFDRNAIVGNVCIHYYTKAWLDEHKNDPDFGDESFYVPCLEISPGMETLSILNPKSGQKETYFKTY